jgi:hypothetical protein
MSSSGIGGVIDLKARGAFAGFGLCAAALTGAATGLGVAAGFGFNHLVNCGPAEVGRRFFGGSSI